MAGVKGRSGGARKNAGGARPNSGGARPGAGRKKKSAANPEVTVELEPQPHGGSLKRSHAAVPDPEAALMDGTFREPLEFLELALNTPSAPLKDRIRAAIAAAQYRHMKKGDGGKKEEQQQKARSVASGRFATTAPPKLVVNNAR